MKRFFLSSFSLILMIGLFSLTFTQCASRTVYVRTPPPKVIVEVRPTPPVRGAIWVAGHWEWRRGKYVWVKGRWVKPRPGYVWVPGRWVRKHRGWVWVPGHWKRRK